METTKIINTVGRRRSDRILAPVRIRVIGKDASGVSFVEETVTISLNQQGARISLTHCLLPDGIVLIKNLENSIEEEFRVVGAFHQVFGGRQEWGVEATHLASEFWGIQFSAPAEGVEPKVLIECAACKTAAHSALSSIDFEVLLSTGLVCRHCDHCRETTRWKPSTQALPAETITSSAKEINSTVGERRKTKRLRLTMCIRVRNVSGVSDIAHTRDVSKNGMCFASTQVYQLTEEVYITLGFTDQHVPLETKAKIIWSSEARERRIYGVCYVK